LGDESVTFGSTVSVASAAVSRPLFFRTSAVTSAVGRREFEPVTLAVASTRTSRTKDAQTFTHSSPSPAAWSKMARSRSWGNLAASALSRARNARRTRSLMLWSRVLKTFKTSDRNAGLLLRKAAKSADDHVLASNRFKRNFGSNVDDMVACCNLLLTF
jgi:hypothetical protein